MYPEGVKKPPVDHGGEKRFVSQCVFNYFFKIRSGLSSCVFPVTMLINIYSMVINRITSKCSTMAGIIGML
ncbi:hypothetical protein LX66_1449 [Chitinophaga japonensis]|uniref:Uncharacterized protein n=1 Tax=Chitinophaga japonensis TaxID=104662 RepID=A0A562TEV5_CHIJA|nr:hypothetical protein LX66_1449 [Chitinophaga japonensis]